jgi:hypothetical protein
MRITALIIACAGLLCSPAIAASSVTPRPGAQIGSAESPYTSDGAYKWWDTAKGDGSDTVMDHVTVTAVQRAVNIEKPIDNLRIIDSEFIGKAPQKNTLYPAGIFAKQGTNLLVENTIIRDWKTIADDTYRQGDCFLAEWGFVGITLRNVTLSGCTDGGYDGKARDVVLDRVVSAENKINYRFWYAPVTATSIVSINPTEAHIQLNTRADGAYGMGPASITADKITFISKGKQPLFWAGPGSIIAPKECAIDVAPGTLFVKFRDGGKASNVTISLGKNCTRDAQGFAVNTPTELPGFDVGENLNDKDGDGLVELQTATTIARINAYLKANGSTVVVKDGTILRKVGEHRYEFAQ